MKYLISIYLRKEAAFAKNAALYGLLYLYCNTACTVSHHLYILIQGRFHPLPVDIHKPPESVGFHRCQAMSERPRRLSFQKGEKNLSFPVQGMDFLSSSSQASPSSE